MTKPDDHGIGGLTKGELFAAMFMMGFCICDESGLPDDENGTSTGDVIANLAVGWADCLISELNVTREAK